MKPLWKQRNFMLLWSGQLVSWLGTEVSGIALPLVVLALTGSPAQVGAVAAIRGVVYVVWAIPAGVLLDRWDRRTVMIVTNLGSGLAMGSIALALFFHNLSVVQLYVASAIEGSFFVFANLGRFISFPKVVSKEQFPSAAAQSGTADHVAILIGPPLGGFLYQTVGGFFAFFLDALSYFANAISILFINAPLRNETATEKKAFHHEVKEALVWLWEQPVLRFINIISAGRAAIASGLYLLLIILAKEQHATSLSIGFIFATGAIGGILGSFIAARIHSRFHLKQLLAGVTGLSFLIFVFYSIANSIVLLGLVTAIFYFIDPLYNVTISSYSTAIIPHIQGRVRSLNRMVVLGAYSFGFFITGILLQYLSSMWTVGIFSIVLLLIFLVTITNKKLVFTSV